MLWDDDNNAADVRVNREYAERFEVRKRKQELDRLRQQYGDDADEVEDADDSEADVEEDEDGDQLTGDVDVQIFRTIDAIRTGDPAVRDPKKRFFDEVPKSRPRSLAARKSGAETAGASAGSARVRLTARDYMLTGAVSDDEDASPGDPRSGEGKPDLSYVEEQRRLKAELVSSFHGAVDGGPGDGEDLLTTRKKTDVERQSEEQDYAEWLRQQMAADKESPVDEEVTLRRYLSVPAEALSSEERFLRDYVTKQLWKSSDDLYRGGLKPRDGGGGGDGDGDDGVDDDAERTERAGGETRAASLGVAGDAGRTAEEEEGFSDREADFERRHNFRFEEPGAAQVVANPRLVEGSVRRDLRKEARRTAEARRQEAKQQALAEKKRELLRLKALKRTEILDRLDVIRKVSGGAAADDLDLDGDFDPDTWDQQMGKVFGADYYAHANEDEAFAAARESAEADGHPALDRGLDDAEFNESLGGEESEPTPGTFEHKVRTISRLIEQAGGQRPDVQTLLAEYYNLDYEDLIAGEIPCRFRYRTVEARSFGLDDVSVLGASDKELNRKVPLGWIKRPFMAHYSTEPGPKGSKAYRPKPPSVSAKDRYGTAQVHKRAREARGRDANVSGNRDRKGSTAKKMRMTKADVAQRGGADGDGSAGDDKETPSKKQMRKKLLKMRKKQAQGMPAVPQDRLAAYEKVRGGRRSAKKDREDKP